MRRTTLPNGLDVLVEENRSSRVAAIQVWVRVGSADETDDEAGLAHVHEHMLFKGTERRAVGAIASEIEAAGGDINAWTSYDQTVYHVTMASRELDVGLDVLSDAVQHSAFDAEELEKELEVVLEEVSRGKDMPGRVVFENLFSTAYTQHPYSRPVIGYVDTVKSFTRDKILDFYRRWYRPKNMCLVVAGDVDPDAVFARAEALFDGDRDAPMPERPRTREPSQDKLRWVRATKDIQETHLSLAWHSTALADEDTAAVDVMSMLLGAGESSRLYRKVKRDAQLVNDCYASSYTPQDPGVVLVGGQVHGDGIEAAYRGLLTETLRLRHEPPTMEEIEKARTMLLSDAVYSKETVQGVARKIGYFELVAGDPGYEQVYYDRVRSVTPADVRRVAEKYLRPEALTVSVLLPEEHGEAMAEDVVGNIALEAERDAKGQTRPAIELGALEVAKVTLDNGATLLVREDRAVPLVSCRVAARGGSLSETPETNGVSYLAAQLITRGTSAYSAEQISGELDAMASGVTGISGRNSLGLRGDFLAEHWRRGYEILSSCLLDSVFDPEELERERQTQLEDIKAREDNLSAMAFEQLAATLWSEHPYRLPVMGTRDSVSSLTRDQIVAAVQNQLNPETLTVAIVGAVDVASTIDMVQKTIGQAKAAPGVKPFALPPTEAIVETPRVVRRAKNREQAHLVLAFPGVDFTDERRWPIDVLVSTLSGQGGRLFLELRDKMSLAYAISAYAIEGLAPGYFAVYIGTSQDKLQKAEAGIRDELTKVIENGVTAEEVERSQRYLVGSYEVALQRASARAGSMALNEAYGLGYDDYARYADRITSVTAAQVHEVARDLLRFERSVMSVIEASDET